MESHIEISNFTAGELSPTLMGRTDLAKYFAGADTLVNFVVMPQGGATKRPGLRYIANATDQARPCRLRRFQFSTLQAYMLEFSDGNVRVYKDEASLSVDIAVPYGAADLAALKFTQSADTLYIWHPNYPPATLTRSSHTVWTYAEVVFRDGPYEDVNTTATTLTPSGTTGTISIVASALVGINAGVGFKATDVGRLIRIKVSAAWGWVKIASVVDPLNITAVVQAAVTGRAAGAAGALDGTTATANWQLGLWSATTGYPYAVTFFQQRLVSGGNNSAPNSVGGSVLGDFTNMAPSDSAGVVTEAHAYVYRIDDDQVNAVRWLSSAGSAHTPQLGIGTAGGEQILQAASSANALGPLSVQAYRETAYGSAENVEPVRVGKAVLFMERSARKLREWSFFWQLDGYDGLDATQLCEHVTRAPAGSLPDQSGFAQLAYQASPYQVLWCRRNDGGLVSITYDRTQQVLAACRHILGGNYYGGPPIVESLDVIPSTDGTYDQLWLSVLRTVNGTPVRFIEVMTRYFDGQSQDEAFFVDAGLSSPLTYPAGTMIELRGLTDTADVTQPPAFTGDGVLVCTPGLFTVDDVGAVLRANGGVAVVTSYRNVDELDIHVIRPMLSLAPAAEGRWSLTRKLQTFSGLGHLTGETVAMVGDGAVIASELVQLGAVAIPPDRASYVSAGLFYRPVFISTPWEPARAAAASSQGKMKRVDSLWLRMKETLGCQFGRRIRDSMTKATRDILEPLRSRSAADPMDNAPPLYTGIEKLAPQGGYDEEGQIVVTQSEPLPLTILSIAARGDVQEGAR